jgi:uncharacterized protein YndB with AHSA1/START domain
MGRQFEVRWGRVVRGTPEEVWDAVTRHSDGWLWPITYEPRVGGAESGLSPDGGVVTAWEPHTRFQTRAETDDGPNQITYVLTPAAGGTHVDYHHLGSVPEDDFARQLDACEVHTTLYSHSMEEYARHFGGRDATYVDVEAGPASEAEGSTARLTEALGIAAAGVGDRVTLAVPGTAPLPAVVDYLDATFVGLRTADGLHRIYGRDRWGWPVSVSHHLFAPDVDAAGVEAAWRTLLDELFTPATTEGTDR